MNIQNLVLDINKKCNQIVTANVGEVGSRFLKINIIDNGMPVDLTGVTVYLYAKKADDTKVFNTVKVEDAKQGIVLVEITSQVLAIEGLIKLTLLLVKDNARLATKIFNLKVDETIIDDEAIESANEFGALTESLSKLGEWNSYFEETSGKIEEKYTERLNQVDSQLEHKANTLDLPSINIKYFDAKCDGVTDDTNALQKAVEFAQNNNYKLVIEGKCLILGSIDLKNKLLVIEGVGVGKTVIKPSSSKSLIITRGQDLFYTSIAEDEPKMRVDFKDISFMSSSDTSNTLGGILFSAPLHSSTINNIQVFGYDVVFSGLGWVSCVTNSFFINIRQKCFNGCMDSVISNNYINMCVEQQDSTTYAICGTLGLSSITNNFIDFATYGIYTGMCTSMRISNNTFDYCYRGVHVGGGEGTVISSNTFNHIHRRYSDRLGVGSENSINNTDWIGIVVAHTQKSLVISSNSGFQVETLIDITNSGYREVVTIGNSCSSNDEITYPSKLINFKTSDSDKVKCFEIKDGYTVNEQPSLAVVGKDMKVVYNDFVYMRKDNSCINISHNSTFEGSYTEPITIDLSNMTSGSVLNLVVRTIENSNYSSSYKEYNIMYCNNGITIVEGIKNEVNSSILSSSLSKEGKRITISAIGTKSSDCKILYYFK